MSDERNHGAIMNKYILSVIFIVCGIFSLGVVANVADSTVPDPFQRFNVDSKLSIDYRDLDSLLDAVVLYTGRSNRKKASPTHSATGTRMKVSVNRSTVNEGNRFYFELFDGNEQNQQTLSQIRRRLENIPAVTPLERFSRDEQLAYWLNLYNVTILDEIVKVYPQRELEKMLTGKDSVLAKKTLTVAGVSLSLNDIQFTILRHNYASNPLVIYGLYQGIIGGPNIRKTAYSGQYVYADLIDNAMEFINSNRGTAGKSKKVFRVSSLYQRNTLFFSDFNADLSQHLLTYLEGQEHDELLLATKIKADINDWTITDLYGSQRSVSGSFSHSNAAMMGAVSGAGTASVNTTAATVSRYSPEVLAHLQEIQRQRTKPQEKTGVVTIEELGQVTDETDNRDGVRNN